MTHDELKAKIFQEYATTYEDLAGNVPMSPKALLAVVELHKPIEEDGKLWCREENCYNHIEFLERTDCDCNYPCPTIQAIEKELS